MPTMPPRFRSPAQRTRAEVKRAADDRRGSARARGYTTAWDKAADGYRARRPLCVYCAMGAWGDPPRVTAAECVDHLIPHRGDTKVFWNKADWVSSCHDCHRGPKQAIERRPADLATFANAVRAFMAEQRN